MHVLRADGHNRLLHTATLLFRASGSGGAVVRVTVAVVVDVAENCCGLLGVHLTEVRVRGADGDDVDTKGFQSDWCSGRLPRRRKRRRVARRGR
eukprot:614207-Prymnesium_polylepis.2